MKNVGVIFGGVTCEHDVSVVTALQLIENINKEKYNIIPIYIHSDGKWYTGEELLNIKIYQDFANNVEKLKKAIIPPNQKGIIIYEKGIFAKEKFIEIDVCIPALHGMNGEDGTIQGLLELANIPYTSSGVLGASVGMDKILMKKVFESYNLPILPYTYFLREEYEKDKEKILKQIEEKLEYPMFVKPSNLGSSIGISKAKDRESLISAIDVAIFYDSRIIVEKAVEDLREINCSALGYRDDVKTSVCEEPISWKEFLTFEDKYLSSNGKTSKTTGAKIGTTVGTKSTASKSGNMENMDRRIPADIPKSKEEEIKEYTVRCFKALDSKGVVRVDYIIDKKEDKIYVNEINTIPGSFSFYLWKYNDMSYGELIEELIKIAEKANEDKNKNNYTFKSDIIIKNSGTKL